jgi:putative DNA primase/helicase
MTLEFRVNDTGDLIEPELRPPEYTDDALALAFAETYSGSLRYVAAIGKWMVWDGMRWHPDETLIARHRARQICRQAAARCNQHKVSKLVASAKTISAVGSLAQADRRIAATVAQWDADPWLLNTPAGIVDLRSGKMRKHDPLAYLTKITGVTPDHNCVTPNWRAFLNLIMSEHAEVIDYLRRVAGYALTGSTREHALFFRSERQEHVPQRATGLRGRLSQGRRN